MWWSCLGPHHTEALTSHRNARLTLHGRRILVERVCSGRPVAHVAAEMGISRPTAYKWFRRWQAEGESGLYDRPSSPYTTPRRTPSELERQVCDLRVSRKLAHLVPPACAGALRRHPGRAP
ncbi:helix-turn-helix domain-containing protein [Streptomyces sp. NBC_01445]|uniref:helix-turn-helix domain-containing protein n=1 Tax=Streptomyces sp. NBC_01445 TaxID=2903869 RepID=UPI002DD950BB|nr:leucine zipper domain-containing protein [Streptomyces sp. NBC_01445]WSE03716.1 leucine zipper domain-containing protein [Streptomyces sp. NBC_01445]